MRYKVGTANIDVADAGKKKLLWEGVAEGELTRVERAARTARHVPGDGRGSSGAWRSPRQICHEVGTARRTVSVT